MRATRQVLVADDYEVLRESVAEVFRLSGWSVRTVPDGFSALAAICRSVPDLLISDLNMEGMSGFELLSVVRRRYPQIRVVAMSGAYAGMAVPAGIAADAFYAKGESSPSMLLEIIATVITTDDLYHTRLDVPVWLPVDAARVPDSKLLTTSCTNCLRVISFVPIGYHPVAQDVCCPHCTCMVTVALIWEQMSGAICLDLSQVAQTCTDRPKLERGHGQSCSPSDLVTDYQLPRERSLLRAR